MKKFQAKADSGEMMNCCEFSLANLVWKMKPKQVWPQQRENSKLQLEYFFYYHASWAVKRTSPSWTNACLLREDGASFSHTRSPLWMFTDNKTRTVLQVLGITRMQTTWRWTYSRYERNRSSTVLHLKRWRKQEHLLNVHTSSLCIMRIQNCVPT